MTNRIKMIAGTAAALVVATMMIGGGAAVATSQENSVCESAQGTLVEFLNAPGSDPASEGTVSGDIEGDYAFSLTSLTELGNSGWSRFTGTAVITTKDGDTITSTDSGMLNTKTDAVQWQSNITGGTGDFADASGHLFFKGTLSFATGEGTATYQGALCS